MCINRYYLSMDSRGRSSHAIDPGFAGGSGFPDGGAMCIAPTTTDPVNTTQWYDTLVSGKNFGDPWETPRVFVGQRWPGRNAGAVSVPSSTFVLSVPDNIIIRDPVRSSAAVFRASPACLVRGRAQWMMRFVWTRTGDREYVRGHREIISILIIWFLKKKKKNPRYLSAVCRRRRAVNPRRTFHP